MGREDSVQISSALGNEKDGNLITLSGGRLELTTHKRSVNICFGQKETVHIGTFCDNSGQKYYFGCSCS